MDPARLLVLVVLGVVLVVGVFLLLRAAVVSPLRVEEFWVKAAAFSLPREVSMPRAAVPLFRSATVFFVIAPANSRVVAPGRSHSKKRIVRSYSMVEFLVSVGSCAP